MNMEEYEKVKDLNYLEYCDYLQEKYGIGLCDYMTENWNSKQKCKRTKEGLLAHHKYEDHAIMLSTKEFAMQNPFEWQKAENIVYCDYLEHLFLHILVCENPSKEQNKNVIVGVGGVLTFMIPELNDFYSGWESKQEWRRICHERIKNDKDVFLALVKRFKYFELEMISLSVKIRFENAVRKSLSDKQKKFTEDFANKKIAAAEFNYAIELTEQILKNLNDFDKRDKILNKFGMKKILSKEQKKFINSLLISSKPKGWSNANNKAIYDEIKAL